MSLHTGSQNLSAIGLKMWKFCLENDSRLVNMKIEKLWVILIVLVHQTNVINFRLCIFSDKCVDFLKSADSKSSWLQMMNILSYYFEGAEFPSELSLYSSGFMSCVAMKPTDSFEQHLDILDRINQDNQQIYSRIIQSITSDEQSVASCKVRELNIRIQEITLIKSTFIFLFWQQNDGRIYINKEEKTIELLFKFELEPILITICAENLEIFSIILYVLLLSFLFLTSMFDCVLINNCACSYSNETQQVDEIKLKLIELPNISNLFGEKISPAKIGSNVCVVLSTFFDRNELSSVLQEIVRKRISAMKDDYKLV